MSNNFANRLSSARKMAGLSLQGLSDKIDNVVSKQSLSKYELGIMKPDSSLVILLSKVLGVSIDYLFSDPVVSVSFENVDYRKYSSKLNKSEVEAIEEKAKVRLEKYFELENILNLKDEVRYSQYNEFITSPDEAEKAAQKLRLDWNLGNDPIPDVIEMLEDQGFKVIEIEAPDSFDGLKADSNGFKTIVLRQHHEGVDIVRKRFTALHELAHHYLKFQDGIEKKTEERLCHVFASAFLYPTEMAKRELLKSRFQFYPNELIIIKERWGISFPAIFSRAHHLGIVSDDTFKQLNIRYRQRRMHLSGNEPGRFSSKEKPIRLQRLVFIALSNELISINEAAYFFGTSVWKFREQMQPIL